MIMTFKLFKKQINVDDAFSLALAAHSPSQKNYMVEISKEHIAWLRY